MKSTSELQPLQRREGKAQEERDENLVLPAKVVFLTHYIPLYQVRVLQAIARRVQSFQVLLSTPMEPNRDFKLDWGDLDVSVQKTFTLRRRWKHRGIDSSTSFVDPLYVHIPYDTTRRLRELRPDVVMSLELGARSIGAIHYCRKHPETKSILCTYMSEHTETNRGWTRQKIRRRLLRQADAITYNGPSCKNYLQQLGADPDRLYRMAYAADDRTLYRGCIKRDDAATRHRLLYVGQLSERKGVLPMLNQVAEYCYHHSDQRIEIVLAGEGPLREQIESYNTPDNLTITLLGNIPPTDLAQQMIQCGATIAPTLADEWLLVVNEALQAGLPVIGSIYAQATTTLIQDGVNGWQYDPSQANSGDKQSLSRVLGQYFKTSPAELSDMRQRCRQSIQHCTPQWAASGAVSAIAQLISRPTT